MVANATINLTLFTITFRTDQPSDATAWQNQLKSIYKTRRSRNGLIPGFPKTFFTDEFFVELKLLEKQELPMQVEFVELKTYTDLLQLKSTQGKSLDHVLVSGLSGTGKTILISRLAYQWATFHENSSEFYRESSTSVSQAEPSPEPSSESYKYLGNFQLVFALDVRKFQPGQDLIDVVREQLLPHVSNEQLGKYLSRNSKGCLFLFDGYDEIGSSTKILSDDMICGCHTIVTTRPKKANGFNEIHKGYVQVSLDGFSGRSIQKFVGSFFKVPDSQSENEEERFLQALRNNETIQNLSHFPLLLAMMCVLWKQEKSLPNSVTVLYKKIIEYLGRHSNSRELSTVSVSQFNEQVVSNNVLQKLGQTALHGLVDENSKLIFQEDEFDSPDTLEKGCVLGLMTKDCTVSGFDTVTNVCFIHKTFQEYCAALYFASLAESDRNLFNTYLSKMDTEDTEYLLKFACGMNENAAKLVLSFVTNQSCTKIEQLKEEGISHGLGSFDIRKDPWRLPLILLFETESKFGRNVSLQQLFIPLVSNMSLFPNAELYDREYEKVLQYYLQKTDTLHTWISYVNEISLYLESTNAGSLLSLMLTGLHNVHNITFKGYQVDCTAILLEIHKNIASHSIEVLKFEDECSCNLAAIKAFLETQPNLSTMSIPHGSWDDKPTNVTILGQILRELNARSGSVTKITLKGSRVDDILMQNVCLFCNSLERLTVDSITRITPFGFQTLFEALITSGKRYEIAHHPQKGEANLTANSLPLKHLRLRQCNIGDSEFTLADAMVYLASLETLQVDVCKPNEKHTGSDVAQALSASLQYTPQLTMLYLSNIEIGSEGAQALSASIKYISQLTVLELSNNNIKSAGAQALSASLKHISQLTVLGLSDNNIGSKGAKALSTSLQYIPELTDLNLSNNSIESEGGQALSESFQYTPHLTRLNLASNRFGSEGAKALSASLQYIPELTDFNLSYNDIESEGAQALSASLKHISHLTVLGLSDNNIGSKGAKALSISLQYIPELTGLDLSNSSIESEGGQALSESFQYTPHLTRLNLDSNRFGSEGAKALSSSLQYIPELTDFDLTYNYIESEGGQALSESFQYTPHLTRLNLAHNILESEGAKALSSSLQYIPELTDLNLSHNSIESEGGQALSESFQYTPHLTRLNLSGTLESEGAEALLSSLQYIPELTDFNLSYNNIESEGAQALSESLQYIPHLKVLALTGNKINSEGTKALSASLKHISQLTVLGLSDNNIGSNGAQALSASFQYIPDLTDLDLSDNSIGSEGWQALSESLQYVPELTDLNLSHNNIDLEGAQALSSSLQYIPDLTSLDVSDNSIESEGVQALSESFQYTPHLTRLNLASNRFESEGAKALSTSLQYVPELTDLNLSNNYIESEGAQALSTSLKHISQLTVLGLSQNYIGSNGAQALSSSLQYIPELTDFDLSHNDIESEGAQALSEALQYIPQLKVLTLTGNKINSEGAKALSASFQYIPELADLNLSFNDIQSEGAQALSSSLQYIPDLTSLDVSDNSIESEGVQALSESFQYTPRLTDLYLVNNRFGSEGAKALSSSLQFIPRLIWLDLSYNNIEKDGAQAILASLKYIPELFGLDLYNNNIVLEGVQTLPASLPYIHGLDLTCGSIGSNGVLSIVSITPVHSTPHTAYFNC